MVDVTVTRRFDAAPEAVARVMFDAARDPEWIGGAKAAEKLTDGPYDLGTRVRRTGGFLGRSFSWETEIVEFDPQGIVRMRYVAGPFRGGVDYAVAPGGGGSEVTIRNYGESSFWFPFMGAMMKASVGRDLERPRALVGG